MRRKPWLLPGGEWQPGRDRSADWGQGEEGQVVGRHHSMLCSTSGEVSSHLHTLLCSTSGEISSHLHTLLCSTSGEVSSHLHTLLCSPSKCLFWLATQSQPIYYTCVLWAVTILFEGTRISLGAIVPMFLRSGEDTLPSPQNSKMVINFKLEICLR